MLSYTVFPGYRLSAMPVETFIRVPTRSEIDSSFIPEIGKFFSYRYLSERARYLKT